jgi:hypothetical protein
VWRLDLVGYLAMQAAKAGDGVGALSVVIAWSRNAERGAVPSKSQPRPAERQAGVEPHVVGGMAVDRPRLGLTAGGLDLDRRRHHRWRRGHRLCRTPPEQASHPLVRRETHGAMTPFERFCQRGFARSQETKEKVRSRHALHYEPRSRSANRQLGANEPKF